MNDCYALQWIVDFIIVHDMTLASAANKSPIYVTCIECAYMSYTFFSSLSLFINGYVTWVWIMVHIRVEHEYLFIDVSMPFNNYKAFISCEDEITIVVIKMFSMTLAPSNGNFLFRTIN